jgi:hypothetical protein
MFEVSVIQAKRQAKSVWPSGPQAELKLREFTLHRLFGCTLNISFVYQVAQNSIEALQTCGLQKGDFSP